MMCCMFCVFLGEPSLNTSCSSTYGGLWLNNTQSCFVLFLPPVNKTNSWTSAQSRCAGTYSNVNNGMLARLAHIYDGGTWSVVAPWLSNQILQQQNQTNSSITGVWFGLYRVTGPATQISATDWRWVNYLNGFQSSLSSTNLTSMGVNMNIFDTSTTCVSLVNGSLWQTVSCNLTLPYLCELYGKIDTVIQ